MTRLVVDVGDFATASRTLYWDVGYPLTAAANRLAESLFGTAGMAGDDSGGTDWARVYDRAASAAVVALGEVTTGAFRLASLFGASGRNYAAADAASNPRDQSLLDDVVSGLPPDVGVWTPELPPSASGRGGGSPHGWDLVGYYVGYLWPNGHQDRLHAAAAAWRRASVDLIVCADSVELVPGSFLLDHLPEGDDVRIVCAQFGTHLRVLSRVFEQLGDACDELAHHLDAAHAAVRDELDSLLEWTAAIEGTAAVFSVFTLGGSEVAGQVAEALRIRAAAANIGALIARFLAAVRAAGQAVATLIARADEVAGTLAGLNGVRLTTAMVISVRATPGLVRTSEIVATRRLTAGTRTIPHIDDPKHFDPSILKGMDAAQVRAGIPTNWQRWPSARGDGWVFKDPNRLGRQIRIMKGYPRGSRPDPITQGPYVVVSQNGNPAVKVPLRGNPTLP